MAIRTFAGQLALSFALCGTAIGQKIQGSDFAKPQGGPPASYFAASGSIPVASIQEAAAKAATVPDHATYAISHGSSVMSTIHSDWTNFSEGAAFSWIADMDVDCDGLDHNCEGNPDGQDKTNWGALSAYEVPYVVIPEEFLQANPSIKPNALTAVICNGKMYYGILGDANGNSPQVTGEASWLMARTCFPDEGLSGGKGHNAADVTYIVFTGDSAVLPGSALDSNYVTDFDALRSMGDKLVGALVSNLRLSGGGNGGSSRPSPSSSSPASSAASSRPTPSESIYNADSDEESD
ncbi:fungal chitosanase of glycosyl hydrolase group 75-domain-containing protein [Aspergillus coremiiformis]|uniref:Endo-chitosanase n=1 Tax=Aspergillus coremiiformis TaxID=138285 RepID=A0A5N6ZGE9_9EURO|nr:fungal chitosanase of glycosyl hydrolase group 75-domain-containing protein [Aspergillus coremiiformis]